MLILLSNIIAAAWLMLMLKPDLPLSQRIIARITDLALRAKTYATVGRVLLGISLALLLFAVIWTLQGDAPMFLAYVLPELAGWLTAFEIGTLADVLVGAGVALVAMRAAGAMSYLKGRVRARRSRRVARHAGKASNDDEPGGWMLAA